MQRTSNYQLPQWEKEDRILMEDFNGAMSNIENAIDGAKDEAKAGIAEAKSEASASFQNSFSPENMPYAIGTYTGTGQSQTIYLKFTPKAVIISRNYYNTGLRDAGTCVMQIGSATDTHIRPIRIVDNGFEVDGYGYETTLYNKESQSYMYIAFR